MLFSTERLICRYLESKDVSAYFAIFGAEDASEFDEFDPISLEDAQNDITHILEQYAHDLQNEVELAICEPDVDQMMGVLFAQFKEDLVYIGYHFSAEFRGKGFASEAVTGFVAHLNKRGYNKIAAKVDSENKRSILLLERIGFTKNEAYQEKQFFKGKDRVEWLYEKF